MTLRGFLRGLGVSIFLGGEASRFPVKLRVLGWACFGLFGL